MVELDGHLGFQRDSSSLDFPNATRVERDSAGKARNEIRLYNNYATAIPVGQPCIVRVSGGADLNPYVVSGAASGTALIERVVVPQAAVPANSWGWFCYGGYCNALVDGSSAVSVGDYLQSAAATAGGLTKLSAFGGNACGIAQVAQAVASAVSIAVYLINERVAIAQS